MSSEEIERNKARYGCWHIACGRRLRSVPHEAAAPWLEQKMRGVAAPIEPVRHIVEGARAYNSLRGLGDPHDIDYHAIRQSADRIHHLSREYERLPLFDRAAVPHFEAMRDEVNHQFDHLTNRMGIRAEFVDHDPYRNAHEMAEDLRNNRRIQVLKTEKTGGHPFFSDLENDRFRTVHDAFGHAGTGRDFDGHGEEAAFHAHARMFSPQARGALASETRGQNGYVIAHDEFGPQKIAVMHRSLWTPEGMRHEAMGQRGPDYDDLTFRHMTGFEYGADPSIHHHQLLFATRPGASGYLGHVQYEQLPDRIYVHNLSVWPDYQRRGVGSALMSELERRHPDTIIDHGVRTPNGTDWAKSFYGHEGIPADDEGWTIAPSTRNHQLVSSRQSELAEDYRLTRHNQELRAERYSGGGRTEQDMFYGRGEHGGVERPVTYKDWLTHTREPRLEDLDPEFRAHWSGYEMGHRHARDGKIDQRELEVAHGRSEHPDHFLDGYHQGLADGFGEHMSSRTERIAVLLGPDGNPDRDLDGRLITVPFRGFAKQAHVSGNTVDVTHCFAGDERFLTPDGSKSFSETVDTVQQVLTTDSGGVHDGRWVKAPVRCYGEQEIWELVLQRNKREKIVRTTAGHRWLTGRPGKWMEQTTDRLIPGNRLAHLRPERVEVEPDRDGIRAGIFLGDGTTKIRGYGARTYGSITLWGEKAKELAEFFTEVCPSEPTETSLENGLTGLRFSSGMAGWIKALPSLDATPAYLRGWLMGYIATDGTVDQFGKVSVSSSIRENLEHVRAVATRLGIGSYAVTTKMRRGFGAEKTPLHEVALVNGDLDASWLLRQKHRDQFARRGGGADRFGWTVRSVRATGEVEPVYCVEVPGTGSFVLEDNIHTKNCPFCGSGALVARSDGSIECTFDNSAFTVTVSPVYPAFPMSVDGQPYPWPGRFDSGLVPSPAGGDDGGSPFGQDDEAGDVGAEADADADDAADEDAAQGSAADAAGDQPGTEAEVGGKKKPPFPTKKKSARSGRYVTATGGEVGVEDYLRHLAIATADDPRTMAARIKRERTG